MAEESSLPYYLPIVGGRIIGLILFPSVLVLCEMQSVSSRIWTRVAVSISYDDTRPLHHGHNHIYRDYQMIYDRKRKLEILINKVK